MQHKDELDHMIGTIGDLNPDRRGGEAIECRNVNFRQTSVGRTLWEGGNERSDPGCAFSVQRHLGS